MIAADASVYHNAVNMARTKKTENTLKEMKKKATLKRRVYTNPPMGTLNPLAEKEMAIPPTDDEPDTPEKKAKKDEVSTDAWRGGGYAFRPVAGWPPIACTLIKHQR